MAFIDKLGQMANKVGEVAGDTFDYGKAKGKIVLEKGKIKDVKEAIGDYVYKSIKENGEVDTGRLKAFCAEIDEHVAEIERLNEEAGKSSDDITETCGGKE